jgi:HEPN domain-containing protein
MNALVKEWISKAEGDFVCVRRECRARKNPVYDAACFHAQQCAEKYLKACLQEYRIPFDKTHKLLHLLELLEKKAPMLTAHKEQLQLLDAYSVAFRYPGASATREIAFTAHKYCESVRTACRIQLHLPT